MLFLEGFKALKANRVLKFFFRSMLSRIGGGMNLQCCGLLQSDKNVVVCRRKLKVKKFLSCSTPGEK